VVRIIAAFEEIFRWLEEIFRWLEEFFQAIAIMTETKRRRHTKKRGRSEYPCWYYFASTAPGWTACGGRVGTNE
jgi:hypothetical protein